MKNTIYKKILSFVSIAVLSLSSCDSFLDINDNPNLLVNVPANTLMTSSTLGTATLMGTHLHRYSAVYMQQFNSGTAQIWDLSRYLLTETDVNDVWRTRLYAGVLSDLKNLEIRTIDGSPHYAGISKILQAFLFAQAADYWGDIPFSEALNVANVTPVYESSTAVYQGAIAMIDEGLALLNQTTSTLRPAGDDLIYNGNLDRWRRFANTLKLRIFLHYYPTNATFATQQITALLNSGALFMRDGGDNFQMRFVAGDADRSNPIHQFEIRRQNQFFPHEFLVTMMNMKNDPRRAFYFTQFGGQFIGMPPNANQNTSTDFSRMHTYLRGAVTNAANPVTGYAGDAPQRILTFAESQFILAEFHARNARLTEAQTAFHNGIRANMVDAGVPTAQIDAYIAARPTLTSANAIQQIIEEKYVANYGVPSEPWVDWRRTGFPQLIPLAGAALPQIPRILPYSELERVTNGANTPTRGNQDIIRPNVFWDPGL